MEKNEMKLIGKILVGILIICAVLIPFNILLKKFISPMWAHVIVAVIGVQAALYMYKRLNNGGK